MSSSMESKSTTSVLGLVLLALSACENGPITLGLTAPEEVKVDATRDEGLGGKAPVVCETISSTTILRPAALAIAFDVSGSMGRLDCPFWNHDPQFKWRPVVDATTAFLEDETIQGVRASMTLFPAASDQCTEAAYGEPDVPLTTLPSTQFRAVLAAYEQEVGLADYADPMPDSGGTWRGGTPTRAAVNATRALLSSLLEAEESTQAAIVLVTDGMPAGCGDDIEHLSDLIGAVSDAHAEGIFTYVIGVREPTLSPDAAPPWEEDGKRVWACKSPAGAWLWNYDAVDTPFVPPDNLANLHTIAAAGGTDRALLIDTGDPEATRVAFREGIDAIRRQAVPCSVVIPPNPDGAESFDKDKIDVRWKDGDSAERLPYDPACEPGGGWHYDDESSPRTIHLCPETCRKVQSSLTLELGVDFLCERREPIVK
jgi:hypothetical protein